ncbi:MAG: WG repeat-containing protein [Bacteroidales bacterium]|nr:WG repeat-containing protein [Bacteroidales bacterium]
MKKILVLGLLVVLSSISLAQKVSYPALVQQALANGRGNLGKGYYMFRPQGNVVPHDEFREYMLRNRYFLIQGSNWAVGSHVRFGNTVKTVLSADFLPESEIGYFLAGMRTPDAKKGKAYLFPGSNSSNAMDVEWDGELSNGYIEGYGSGVVSLGNRQYYLFSGRFHNGIVNGNLTITQATVRITDRNAILDCVFFPAETKKVTKASYYVGDFINGFAPYSQNNKWGFVDQYGNLVVKPIYGSIVSSFNSEGYAVVLNNKKEEIKVNKYGTEMGYSDHQAAIYEEQRLAAEREAARIAEEKRQAERKAAEIKKYMAAKEYYRSFNNTDFKTAYEEYMKEYPNDMPVHRIDLEKMKSNLPSRESRIAKGMDMSKWHEGDQICVSHDNGLLYGIVERLNNERTAAQVRIISGPSGYYESQALKHGSTIWIQKNKGWHIALDEEIEYANESNGIYKPIEERDTRLCGSCAGKGYTICSSCKGSGWNYNDRRCSSCDGLGKKYCYSCDGTGVKK